MTEEPEYCEITARAVAVTLDYPDAVYSVVSFTVALALVWMAGIIVYVVLP